MPGWVWDSLQADFEDGLERLKQFVAREGHARVPQRHKNADGFALGTWVGSRRKYYKKSELSPERIAALEAVPGWVWDPFEYDFQNGLERLKQFIAREGHAQVPQRHKNADGFALGKWVAHRREGYKNGEIPQERIAALESVTGWVWDPLEADFQNGLALLKEFVARESHARVPRRYKDADGFALGTWVTNRRMEYKKVKLPPERIAELDAVPGWVWDPFKSDFNDGIDHLKKFVAREGHARVPLRHKDAVGFALGQWVTNRRMEYKKGNLLPERIAALEAVPGWVWNVLQE